MQGCLASVGVLIAVMFVILTFITVSIHGCVKEFNNVDKTALENKDRPIDELGYKYREQWSAGIDSKDAVKVVRVKLSGVITRELTGSVFNGDIGIIKAIDPQMETLTVVYDDKEADYDFTQLNELEPAYAMTVHKSQGSEYRAVILSAWNASSYLLSRSILYTAITRARELLIIAGRPETVVTMTQNAKTGRRYSGLKLRLQQKED